MTERLQGRGGPGQSRFLFGLIFGLLTAALVTAGFRYWLSPGAVLATWYIFVLFLTGVLCLLVEAALPGVGFFGVAGVGLIVLTLFMAASRPDDGWQAVALAAAVSPYLTWLAWRLGVRRLFQRQLTLKERLGTDEGYVAGGRFVDLVGKTGTALTPLRPAGSVEIDGRRIDVVTGGEYIPAGAAVTVVKVDNWHVTVRTATDTEAAVAAEPSANGSEQ